MHLQQTVTEDGMRLAGADLAECRRSLLAEDGARLVAHLLHLLTALLQVVWQGARVWGSVHTIQSHAFTLTNLHGILLVPYMFYTRRDVHKWEVTGATVALLGAILMIADPYALRVG